MREFILGAALVGTFGFFGATHAQQNSQQPARAGEIPSSAPLPRPGNLPDILNCAGANEVFWTTAMKDDPRNPEAHEARRKAGWYSAVALWVFQVDSSRVIDAVKTASAQARRTEVLALASVWAASGQLAGMKAANSGHWPSVTK